MRAIHSSRKPVRDVNVIRCEFCWTISKFLDAIHVPYEMIEFDLLKYAERSRREIPPRSTFLLWQVRGGEPRQHDPRDGARDDGR